MDSRVRFFGVGITEDGGYVGGTKEYRVCQRCGKGGRTGAAIVTYLRRLAYTLGVLTLRLAGRPANCNA